MASKYQLQMELRQYETLKENLRTFAANDIEAANGAKTMADTLRNHYKIEDDTNKATVRAEKLSKEIQEEADYIKNTVIPAIDKKMEEIRKEIERIEEEERRAMESRSRRASSIRFRW